MKKKQYFYVPWHKEEGYLGAYTHPDKEFVIKDMEICYTLDQLKWTTLRKQGWKILKVEFKPVK